MEENTQFELMKKGFGYRVLTFLYKNQKRTDIYGSIIAKNSTIAEANISPVLKILEKLELIKRTVNSKSKRIKYLALTPEGLKLASLLAQVDIILNKQNQKLK